MAVATTTTKYKIIGRGILRKIHLFNFNDKMMIRNSRLFAANIIKPPKIEQVIEKTFHLEELDNVVKLTQLLS